MIRHRHTSECEVFVGYSVAVGRRVARLSDDVSSKAELNVKLH
jgi:hypothetical protein